MDAIMSDSKPTKGRKDRIEHGMLGIRSRREWLAWVDALAKHDDRSTAVVVTRALAQYARSVGFAPEPPERV